MTPIAIEKGQHTHVAIGQIVESYVMMTLVDFFGDVPYSEIAQGSEGVFNPVLDAGASVYEAVDLLLADAVTNLNMEELSSPSLDLYYGGNENQWKKLANTLRLKLHLQKRLVDEVTSKSIINKKVTSSYWLKGNSNSSFTHIQYFSDFIKLIVFNISEL